MRPTGFPFAAPAQPRRSLARRWRIALAALLLAPLTGSAAFQIRSVPSGSITRVYLADVAAYYGLKLEPRGNEVSLTSGTRQLLLTLDKRQGRINGVAFSLFFAPTLKGRQVLIAERDLTLQIDPVFRGWGLPAHEVGRIAIDPGHGGRDSGASGRSAKEKDLCLQVALKLKKLLTGVGYEVMMTRSDDRFVTLPNRSKAATAWGADVFVSVHMNSADDRSVTGIETFVATPKGAPATYRTRPESDAVTGNQFDRLSARLGYEVQRHLVAAVKAKDRGVKHFRWSVLAAAGSPAVLVELGFLSTPAEEARLRDPAHQQRLAVGIANGVISLHRALALERPE